MIDYNNIAGLKNNGFEGFERVYQLIKTGCYTIPRQKGIYFVLYDSDYVPRFLETSVGGHFKGRNPTVEIKKLEEKWVDNTNVIYIGQAGSGSSKATLHSRLKQYMRFGEGKPVGHWGGRLIWQLEDNRNLIICWKTTPNDDPREIEKALIVDFNQYYKKLPFANLKY